MSRTILLAVAICSLCAGAYASQQYTVTALGTLPGYTSGSEAYGINNSGQIVGYAYDASGTRHAFLYSGGQMQDLNTLGGAESAAWSINDSGQIVGYAQTTGGSNHAFLYSGGHMQDLGNWTAHAINNTGQIAGQNSAGHPIIYSGGNVQDLGTLTGGTGGSANGINNTGQAVGQAYTAGDYGFHAFLYNGGGSLQDLGAFGGTYSQASSINNAGQVVGSAQTASGSNHAFLYSNGQMNDLGTLPGGQESDAYGINDSGLIVGSDGGSHALLYSNGAMIDLNTLITPTFGWTLGCANAINDEGQIVGYEYNTAGQTQAFLLSPVPEPMTAIAVGMGIAGLSGYIRRRRMAVK